MATRESEAGSSKQADLASLMDQLGINEDELDDVVFKEEDQIPPEATRWLAIARVHTDKEYSQYWFYKNMRSAWYLAQEVKFKALEDNLYLMQFSCLGDWEKVMEGGPWAFRGKFVLIEEYDGYSKPSSIELNHLRIWIQIHDLPFPYRAMVKKLAGKVGEFVCVDPISDDFTGNFYRARVKIDVREPLQRVVSLSRQGKRELFLVKFEKLQDWCSFCGHLGHIYKEHGDGLRAPGDMKFGGLLAEPMWRQGTRSDTGRGRGRGRGGRNPGLGTWMDLDGNTYTKVTSEGRGFGRSGTDEKETEADIDMEEGELSLKRAAAGEKPNVQTNQPLVDHKPQGTVVQLVNQFELPSADGSAPLAPGTTPPSPLPKHDLKRMKKGGSENAEDDDQARSAGSFEEYRREQ